MSRSRHSRTVRAPGGVVPGNSAGKGAGARKNRIMRCYSHGAPDAEERAIERHERQRSRKEILADQGTMSIDVLTVINYDMVDPRRSVIYTNAKSAVVTEILTEWCATQVGTGDDPSELTVKDSYTIKLGLELADGGDDFFVQSDTGNKALTLGIVMDVLARGTVPIKPLEEMP